MCGRFTLTTDLNPVQAYFPFAVPAGLAPPEPRYNIAPSELIWAVGRTAAGLTEAEVLRWGLVPPWAKTIQTAWINARAETAATRPAFRTAVKTGRILALADSWFEWTRPPGAERKQPYRVVAAAGHPLLFAGLKSVWRGPDGPIATAAIVTRAATSALEWLHPRMPLILEPDGARAWLEDDPAVWVERLMAPPEPPALQAYPVSARVNRPGINDPGLIHPLVG